MRKNFIAGLLFGMLCLWTPVRLMAFTPDPNVWYYILVDTATVDVGYLQVDPDDGQTLIVDNAKGINALWQFRPRTPATLHEFRITNKQTGQQLILEAPSGEEPAVISAAGDLAIWDDLFVDATKRDTFITYSATDKYYLTYDGEVKIAKETAAQKKISFRPERYRFVTGNESFRIKVKVAGAPLSPDLGYLCADTIKPSRDSLRVEKERIELTLWKFALDTIINDSAVYKIKNVITDSILAFHIPVSDTVATLRQKGALNQWRTPFHDPDSRTGIPATRDTVTGKQYYLGVAADTTVMLIGATSSYERLSFVLEDETLPPPPTAVYRFDTTMVYTIKNVSTQKTHYYTGYDFDGTEIYLDSVYAHIPDGQFIVNRLNTHSLINRSLVGGYTDTIHYCYDTNGVLRIDTFVYRGDTVTIKPITDAGFDRENPYLGYKYITAAGLSDSSYYFAVRAPDSLSGRILGTNQIVMLLPKGDTATFLMEQIMTNASVTAYTGVASLQKPVFILRSEANQSLYLSEDSPSQMTTVKAYAGLFYLKEDTARGNFYLIRSYPSNDLRILVLDAATKRLHMEKRNPATHKSLFHIGQEVRMPTSEPDPFTYLKQFPDTKGKGYYEFMVQYNPPAADTKFLTKDYYDNAALGMEGESMLRAGSYTPYDLQLWLDTGAVADKDKPPFYIVKDVDTTAAGTVKINIKGYFLHVMDSSRIDNPDNYIVEVGGIKYNRLNFVHAERTAVDRLKLASGKDITNTTGINEYQFYFQNSDESGRYYLVTENFGESRKSYARGYLSRKDDTLYVGPREHALKVQIRGSAVSNGFIPPASVKPAQEVIIVGGTGKINLLNAAGQPVYVYSIPGRLVARLTPLSDHETIPVQQGVLFVRIGDVTRKVVVR